MPLVSIDVLEGRPPDQLDQICDSVAQAMVELLDVPERDRFQVVTAHQPGGLRFDRDYLDIERPDRRTSARTGPSGVGGPVTWSCRARPGAKARGLSQNVFAAITR